MIEILKSTRKIEKDYARKRLKETVAEALFTGENDPQDPVEIRRRVVEANSWIDYSSVMPSRVLQDNGRKLATPSDITYDKCRLRLHRDVNDHLNITQGKPIDVDIRRFVRRGGEDV